MQAGDILKYTPTSTVGKVTDIRERDGKTWVCLDVSGLYYDARMLIPADASEYRIVSFKERERAADDFGSGKTIEDLHKMEEEVDITQFTPSGGG